MKFGPEPDESYVPAILMLNLVRVALPFRRLDRVVFPRPLRAFSSPLRTRGRRDRSGEGDHWCGGTLQDPISWVMFARTMGPLTVIGYEGNQGRLEGPGSEVWPHAILQMVSTRVVFWLTREFNSHSSRDGAKGRDEWATGILEGPAAARMSKPRPSGLEMAWGVV